jgi:hypothetical protein
MTVSVERFNSHARPGRARRDPGCVTRTSESRSEMDTRRSGNGLQATVAVARQGIDQRGVPLAIEPAHAADVMAQMALDDEGRKRVLRQQRARPGNLLRGDQRLPRPWRRNHEAEAQCREQALGEGPDIEHGFCAIERLQRVKRRTLQSELAVIVVLDDDGAASLSEIEQLGSPPGGHGHAQRELM